MVNSDTCSSCCDAAGCGRMMTKAKKIHEGLRYCDTCYARLFKKRLCSECGNHARLPIFDASAICTKCRNSRPCIRCHRVGRPVGKLTAEGPVCNSCAHYVEAAGLCEMCGEFRNRLVNKTVDGQVRRCCTRCANTAAATCSSCRRHRILTKAADGTMQCKLCAEIGEVACKSCGNCMPAGLGSECTDCYWKRTAYQRLSISAEERFSNSLYREAFYAYGIWLIEQVSGKEAALRINKHMLFFVQMAEKWACLPTYEQLLKTFGADWLRRAKYPVRWMVERHGLEVDEKLKQQTTERRRIAEILASVGDGVPQEMLSGYHDFLVTRAPSEGTSLASTRMALRSAANLLAHCSARRSLPSSRRLHELLVSTPGIAASLRGFITYLNDTRSLSIKFPKHSETQKLTRLKREQKIITLARQAKAGEDVMTQWVPAALRFFHGVSRIKQSDLTVHDDVEGLLVTAGETEYWIPTPLMGLSLR